MQCIRDGCDAEALVNSNYCIGHRPKSGFMSRSRDSVIGFSEWDGKDAGEEEEEEEEE